MERYSGEARVPELTHRHANPRSERRDASLTNLRLVLTESLVLSARSSCENDFNAAATYLLFLRSLLPRVACLCTLSARNPSSLDK